MRNQFDVKSKHQELFLASMGIYVFKAKVLKDLLVGREADFGKEIIPKAIENFNCYGYVFSDYWRDNPDPVVKPVLGRVSLRRLEYLTASFRQA